MRFILLLLLLIPQSAYAAFDSANFNQVKELKILRVTPNGNDVPAGRQIVIQFSRPVVPIGKMSRDKAEIPVTIKPEVNCEWRWLNTSALSCNLDEKSKLIKSTKYTINIKPGIKTEDGQTIAEEFNQEFITERPDIEYQWFKDWQSPGRPVIRLSFNQPVTLESVRKHIFLEPSLNSKRYTLKVSADKEERELPDEMDVPGTKLTAQLGHNQTEKNEDDAKVKDTDARNVWLITPEDDLPLNTVFDLKLEPGLATTYGTEESIDKRTIEHFATFGEFKFLGIKCFSNRKDAGEDNTIFITPENIETQEPELCNPLASVMFAFSAPVRDTEFKNNIIFAPDLANGRKDYDPWSGRDDSDSLSYSHSLEDRYYIMLPFGLKSEKQYTATSKNAETSKGISTFFSSLLNGNKSPETQLHDQFGRVLQNKISIKFTTDSRKPNYVLDYHDAILESKADSEVPLYVNNLTETNFLYRRLTTEGSEANLQNVQTLPDVRNIQFAVPLKIREMLGGKSGAIYGSLTTTPQIDDIYRSKAQTLFAEVTPYQVHVKLGHFNTFVWVTDMATGEPVKNADVKIYPDQLTNLGAPRDVLAKGVTSDEGLAILPGNEQLDPTLKYGGWGPDYDTKLFVRVDKNNEMALMPLSYNFMINSYRSTGEYVYSQSKQKYGHISAWGTTAQGIYHAGEKIQYKIYVRDQDNLTLKLAPNEKYTLKIFDAKGKKVSVQKNITLNEFGSFNGEYTVPKNGAVGWYNFKLHPSYAGVQDKSDDEAKPNEGQGDAQAQSDDENDNGNSQYEYSDEFTWQPLRVLVSDFTPAPFNVTNQLNGEKFGSDQDIEVSTFAKLHSGGPYGDANVRVTAQLKEKYFLPNNPQAKGFQFGSYIGERDSSEITQKIEKLNDKGEHILSFRIPEQTIYYGNLMVESAVQDDRGKYVAAASNATYLGVDRFVGLKNDEWMFTANKPAAISYIVVDSDGNPIEGTPVNITIEKQETKAARVKDAGNAYSTEYKKEWVTTDSCNTTSVKGAAKCEFTPKEAGYYHAVAKIKDTKGKEHSTEIHMYITGGGYVLWDQGDDNDLEIIPEKTEYKVGDTARYLIKNPFPGAKALVTIERYGVMDHFTQVLDGSTPTIEFKVKPDYMPGYYLSVIVFSPRVDKPIEFQKDIGQVDLGKPTFKMGYVSVPVTDPYKQMVITAKAENEVYKPGDNVKVKLHAEPKFKDHNEPIEFAITVLDESVFDMVQGGKDNFDPYKGFYKLTGLDLRNYSLITRLVGRQKFEKKGANQGGDGGADLNVRNNFKYVSYWNGSVKADKNGDADIEFKAPDNLTGWRVLAMAVTPTDRLGLGEGKFKVNRPTEIRPAMPNQVTEGDEFQAGFNVMNRTDKERELKVKITASGDINDKKYPATYEQSIKLQPYKRHTILMPIQTKSIEPNRNIESGNVKFIISAGDEQDHDALEYPLTVNKRRSLETAATYGTTVENHVEESLKFPEKIHADVGNVSVVTSPSVIANITGAFKFMQTYPYSCWEQLITKAVMASHYKNLRAYLPDDMEWPQAETLTQSTLDDASSFQAPNGGMTYFLPLDKYSDPYLSAYTALAFNWMRNSGYNIPADVERKLHKYLQNFLANESLPEFYNEDTQLTVRAVALAALAEKGEIQYADLERYHAHLKQMSLFAQTYFLQAALKVKGTENMVDEVSNLILSHADQSGGKFQFTETLDDSYKRILATPLRENCAILSAFTELGEKNKHGAELVGDVPFKLVRMITQSRGSRDHWENTQENVFCMNGLIDYSRVYENVKPNMKVNVSMDNKNFGNTNFTNLKDKEVTFTRNIEEADPGRSAKVSIDRKGDGRLYYAARMSFAPLEENASATNAGMEITREYSVERNGKWEILKSPFKLKQSELVRVDIYLSLPASRNFVVVNDPVPGGLEPVNRDLATTSTVDADKGEFAAAGGSIFFKFNDWISYSASRWSFYHKELRHNAAIFYSDYLSPGNYHLSYTAQAIAPGKFVVMPTDAEEMYDPDVFGKTIPEQLEVSPLE